MIPSTENPATAEESFAYAASGKDCCEESRCNQLQTAADVYRRLAERLQRQDSESYAPNPHEEILRQIWIASFTGGNIYYRA